MKSIVHEATMQEQEEFLDQALTRAAQKASLMKLSIDKGELREVLVYSEAVIEELKISTVEPKLYYILC